MVLLWALAGSVTIAAGALCLRLWYRWQSKAEAGRIVRAIERGDAQELAMLWAERGYADAVCDWFGDPVLIVAARRSSVVAVRVLLGAGAAVDERGVGWMTALMYAAEAGDQELCRVLLEYGADPDARDAFGRPAAWRSQELP